MRFLSTLSPPFPSASSSSHSSFISCSSSRTPSSTLRAVTSLCTPPIRVWTLLTTPTASQLHLCPNCSCKSRRPCAVYVSPSFFLKRNKTPHSLCFSSLYLVQGGLTPGPISSSQSLLPHFTLPCLVCALHSFFHKSLASSLPD